MIMMGNPLTMNAAIIEQEYQRLGYSAGWRFMMSPERYLSTSDVAIVGLNPGGIRRHGPEWSQELGNAYVVESWGGQRAGADPLQRQVQRLCQMVKVAPHEVFAAQFVPFRSNAWSDLARRPEAVAFARRLWAWALPQSEARLIVCLGKAVVAPEIAQILGAQFAGSVLAGWGNQTIDRYVTDDGRLVLGVPHLGRFKLFGRPVSEAAFRNALG